MTEYAASAQGIYSMPSKGEPSRAKPRGDFSALVHLLFSQKAQLVFVGIVGIASALTSLAQPLVVAQAIESVTAGTSLSSTIWILAGLLIAATVLTGIQQYLLQRIGEGVVLDSRRQLIRRVFRLRISEYDRRSTGDFVSRINSDTTLLRVALIQSAVSALSGIAIIIGAGIAMAFIDAGLLGLTLLIIVLSLAVVLSLGVLVKKASTEAQQSLGDLSTALERGLRGVRTVRATNSTRHEELRVEDHAVRSWKAGVSAAKFIAIISPVSGLCTQISLLTVLGIGGYRVNAGQMSVADLVAFMLFLVMLVVPLGQAFGAVGSINQALGAFGRIREILSLPTEDVAERETLALSAIHVALAENAVSFTGVDFSYEEHDGSDGSARTPRPVLSQISFSVPAGKRIALVGPSGAGKSTIFQLIERFYDASDGSIQIFGKDIQTLDRNSLRAQIGYVEQDAPALGGTIRENLTMAKPNATDDECLAALASVNLLELTERSGQGLNHQIGDGGVTLSGGERQRLAIARALLSSPPLLLLDESTSSLDSRNEVQMRKAIDAVAAGRSLMVIAHRLATVIDSDEIIVVDNGQVIGKGTHEELLASTPLYRDLAENQLLAS
ncbi:ABC transporter ATP-binding protein [Cryobacterium sp. SO2]|uniref:ABC transporter ATP-binding protein n=1 Tax=Cryobacterium sp. SO2 TaxID=1897060 RepID=UPI00223DF0D7|nr:ABC transporter ATP-binding protein [Cryobacterium sp. SO2]WEO78731.1 ABC transporter ATP-binding protein [Cryobacterium sp. SO2]